MSSQVVLSAIKVSSSTLIRRPGKIDALRGSCSNGKTEIQILSKVKKKKKQKKPKLNLISTSSCLQMVD